MTDIHTVIVYCKVKDCEWTLFDQCTARRIRIKPHPVEAEGADVTISQCYTYKWHEEKERDD